MPEKVAKLALTYQKAHNKSQFFAVTNKKWFWKAFNYKKLR